MTSFKSVVLAAANGQISLQQAEWSLRDAFGNGVTQSKYQEIYNYLDEIAGVVDGGEETAAQRAHFLGFLARLGFPDSFD